MALNLKNPRTLAAIDELAQLTGQSKADAVASAVEARIEAILADHAREQEPTPEERLSRVMALLEDTAARFRAAFPDGRVPTTQELTDELYNEFGMPV